MTYAAPPPTAPQPPALPRNGFGITALVTGIVGLAFAWIPFIGFLGFILGALAIIFGGLAVYRAHKDHVTSKGMAYAGLILGIISFVVSLVVWTATVQSFNEEFGTPAAGGPAQQPPPAAGPLDAGGGDNGGESQQSGPSQLAFGESHTWPGGETITVSAPQPYTSELGSYSGAERQVAVDVTIQNNSNDEFDVAQLTTTAKHANRPAQESLESDMLSMVKLPPGDTVTLTKVYDVQAETGDLQLSVQPNYFAVDTVYYTGQF